MNKANELNDYFMHCPCGSGNSFELCCQSVMNHNPATTALMLMRSRYSAYALKNSHYLTQTWHSSTRPNEINILNPHIKWIKLEIIDTSQGAVDDLEGYVEFKATYLDGDRCGALHEKSRFGRESGLWVYIDGEIINEANESKISRNQQCPCGSGQKFKRCCGLMKS